nr:RNA-directed DNA polymerase, eukaryota, reverse transcriptase zinc-binding domain protein [Tanacetum cinerariifolium]
MAVQFDMPLTKNYLLMGCTTCSYIESSYSFGSIVSLEEKIDLGRASNEDREEGIKLLQECDDLEKMAAMDMVQKARIRWDVEGDENTKYFHGVIKQKRRHQMVQGLMTDGVWVSNPNEVKMAFFFQVQDSSLSFSPMNATPVLDDSDPFFLEDTDH